MKTLLLLSLMTVLPLVFIETLHVIKHENYCKTEAEWIKSLPPKVRNQLR